MAKNKLIIPENFIYSLPSGSSLDFINSKQAIFDYLVYDKLGRTLDMFEYEGFPDTFDGKMLEMLLQSQGYAIVCKVNDELYVLNGNIGGELDASYQPTLAIPVSPYLNYSDTLEVGKECVVVKNNYLYRGMNKINSLYAGLLTEAYTSLKVELWNLRIPSIIRTNDDSGKQRADNFFKAVKDGDLSAMVSDESLEDIIEGAKALDYANKGTSNLKDTMEIIQYLQARWNIELALNDNYNMKRESLNAQEIDSNISPLLTIVDSQLASRQKGVEEINKLFGTNGKVKLGKNWQREYEYVVQALENAEADNEKQEEGKIEQEVAKETKQDE